MTKEALIEKIESLPPEKRAEVEDFADSLKKRNLAGEPTSPSLAETLRRQRERLLREHDLYDTLADPGVPRDRRPLILAPLPRLLGRC